MQLIRPTVLMAVWLLAFPALAQDEVTAEATTTVTRPRSDLEGSNNLEKLPPEASEDAGRVLELRSAIEEALRRNPMEQVRGNQAAQLDLQKQNLAEEFWLPNLNLDLAASNQRYDRLYTSAANNPGMGSQVAPNGRFGLSVEDYTIFNWGRDYLAYQNEKHTLNRGTQRLNEARRQLRFSVISQYFNLIRVKEILKIKREQLRQTSFIHRLAREKLQLRKITSQQYYQTRAEFLRSQTEYQQAMFDVSQEDEKMANLMGDEYRTSYRPAEMLKYVQLNTSMEEALRLTLTQSIPYRDAKLEYENASRSYEKTLKDNLPLPKFSLSLGTWQQQFAPEGTSWLRETTPGSRNVDIVAALDMKWTLIGEGGFFNSRQNQNAYLEKRIAEINFFNAKRALEVKVRTIYKTIKFLEQKVTIADYQEKNARSNFDTTLDNYIGGRTTYPDIKLSLDSYIDASMNSENVRYDHLLRKLELSDFMGMEDLPGENFETLATR